MWVIVSSQKWLLEEATDEEITGFLSLKTPLVVSIFFCLFLHFRKHLKNVILVFLETIFLKLLDSGNSSYHHKHLILNVFDKISQNSMMWLEIFVNYDCDISQRDISKQIVEQLSKIANGKFTKGEHKTLINAQEELVLRSYAM